LERVHAEEIEMDKRNIKKLIRENEAQIAFIQRSNEELRQKLLDKDLPALQKKWMGKCFKYHNSYSCTTDEDKWWVYAKITRVTDAHEFEATEFQDDKQGEMHLRTNRYFSSDGWISITEEEYQSAWLKFMDKVTSVC
jgi:hypothetical protein